MRYRSIALVTHLTELHISENLAQHAEGIHIRALLMQTDLENAAQAILHVKTIVDSRNPAPREGDLENSEMEALFQKADAIISQIRSAKVVCNKAIHQLEDLNARSLTLSPSTLINIECTQSLVSELASAATSSGLLLINELGTDETIAFTYAQIVDALSPGDVLPFASLSSKVQQTVPSLQAFYALTNNLSQTVELSDIPSRTPPWEILAKRLQAENAASAQHEQDAIRLRAEIQEKNTSLVLKDKALDEMMVNMEVLEKRMSDSGGRRERVRELEGEIELAQSKSRDLALKVERLERDLKMLEAERESWRKQASENGPRADTDTVPQSATREKEVTPTRASEEIERLQSEVSILQSTVRHLRLSAHQATIFSAHSFLSTPLVPKAQPSPTTLRSQEVHDVLHTMLQLVTHPQSQVIALRSYLKEERLRWRPMRDSPGWQVSGQKEQWASWKEWRDDMGKQMSWLSRTHERPAPPSGRGRRRFDPLYEECPPLGPTAGKGVLGEVAVVGSADYQGKVDLGLP